MTRSRTRVAALGGAVLALALALVGCASTPTTTPSTAPSTPGAVAIDPSALVTAGKLTIATGDPAYFPYVIDDKPESGQGFEAAVAYAVANKLGFTNDQVVWVRTGFDEAIAPGPKSFDFNIQQFSITDERKQAVDFSSPYYSATQAVVTIKGSKADGATTLAALKDDLIGAATGTTSFDAIEQDIQPTQPAQAFSTNDDAVAALTNKQVDAIVVDLPTAFYLTGAELDNGVLVGQLPPVSGAADQWGLLLPKGSALTPAVTAAVDALRADGTLDALAQQWLGAQAGAPELQ